MSARQIDLQHVILACRVCKNKEEQAEFCLWTLQALLNVVGMLKPGSGRLLLRDYASGDYAQQRFLASQHKQQLGDGSFVRGDGTLACYFEEVGTSSAQVGCLLQLLKSSIQTCHFWCL